MSPAEARRRFASARVARLATVGASGAPHIVPVVFAVDGDAIFSTVDAKPKRTTDLQRLRNVEREPRVALLADHYEEDWDALWWARADGTARVLDPRDPEARRGRALLAQRYATYREAPPAGAVLVVAVTRWSGWRASPLRDDVPPAAGP